MKDQVARYERDLAKQFPEGSATLMLGALHSAALERTDLVHLNGVCDENEEVIWRRPPPDGLFAFAERRSVFTATPTRPAIMDANPTRSARHSRRSRNGSPAPHQVNDDPSHYGLLIGLVTFDGAGDDDDDVTGVVEPSSMKRQHAERIPDGFWSDLHDKHGVALANPVDVYLAAAGWTWLASRARGTSFRCPRMNTGIVWFPRRRAVKLSR